MGKPTTTRCEVGFAFLAICLSDGCKEIGCVWTNDECLYRATTPSPPPAKLDTGEWVGITAAISIVMTAVAVWAVMKYVRIKSSRVSGETITLFL